MEEQVEPVEQIAERRLCSRTAFNAYVELRDKTRNIVYTGKMTDVSMFGLFVQLTEDVPLESECHIRITIPAKNSKLILEDIEGRVVRRSEHGVGIAFSTAIEWFALFNVYSYYGRE